MGFEKEKYVSSLDFLPEAMVNEMLINYRDVINNLSVDIYDLYKMKEDIREKLKDIGLLNSVKDIIKTELHPTTSAADGTYVIMRQVAVDIVCIAAVAVEGFTPPKEARRWDKPHHIVKVFPVNHHTLTPRLCRAIMFMYEVDLASKAPHNVVFIDGSLTSPLIGIGQGLSALYTSGEESPIPEKFKEIVFEKIEDSLESYYKILTSPNPNQVFVGCPKYSSRCEVIMRLKEEGFNSPLFKRSNDKALLSLVLEANEVIGPIALQKPLSPWHLSGKDEYAASLELEKGVEESLRFKSCAEHVVNAMNDIHVIYVKTSPIHPALRVEVSKEVIYSPVKFMLLLQALLDQSQVPGVLEPYPLYLADLFVKHAYLAISELQDITLADVSRAVKIDPKYVTLSLQAYRTEGGFD